MIMVMEKKMQVSSGQMIMAKHGKDPTMYQELQQAVTGHPKVKL